MKTPTRSLKSYLARRRDTQEDRGGRRLELTHTTWTFLLVAAPIIGALGGVWAGITLPPLTDAVLALLPGLVFMVAAIVLAATVRRTAPERATEHAESGFRAGALCHFAAVVSVIVTVIVVAALE
ncbi:MAG: hypothetical protein ACTJHU_07540 [Mycetocola sp.]